MFQLMKIEARKAKLGWYIKGAILANIIIAVFMVFFMGFIDKIEEEITLTNLDEVFIVIGALVRATFTIFAAVLIARLIIEEFKEKTVYVLFTYPIPRKKIIISKLIIVVGLTFITTLCSNVFVAFVFLSFNAKFYFVQEALTTELVSQQLLSMGLFAIGIAGTGLIPLYFGMKKHSVPATIISSIIIVFLISSHNPSYSIASIVYVPLSFAVIGLFIAWWSIKGIEKIDL